MRKSEEALRDVPHRNMAFLCSVVVFLALFAGTGAAAPVAKPRVKKTVFSPITSKPVWVADATRRSDPALTDVFMQQLGAASAPVKDLAFPSVVVPTRPSPRSPFVPPPQGSVGDIPCWVVDGL
jgi:hypothetical protein